jgi:hypothetical protein
MPYVEQSNRYSDLDTFLGLQEVEAPRISRQSAQEGGEVVSTTHRPPLHSRGDSWYSLLLESGRIRSM